MLYEGVSARPTTIPLAEVRESVSGQPMSAAGSATVMAASLREVCFAPRSSPRSSLQRHPRHSLRVSTTPPMKTGASMASDTRSADDGACWLY
jgi:hypothetical protein